MALSPLVLKTIKEIKQERKMKQLTLPYGEFLNETVAGINERYQKAERSLCELADYVKEKVEEGTGYGKSKEQVYRDLSKHPEFKPSSHTLKQYDITARFIERTGRSTDQLKVPVSTVERIATSSLTEEDKEIVFQVAEDKGLTQREVRQEIKKIQHQERIGEIEQEAKLPDGLFDVIVVDPPWPYGTQYDSESRRVANPYPEMSEYEILNLEIPAKDDCVLWLWTTHKFLPDALDISDQWGFDYKATLVWDKEKMGMGHWLRMQCEFCLLGVKGNPVWNGGSVRDIIREPRREHSRKPDKFYEMVDTVCVGKKLDYFSREKREGWEQFGNQTDKL